MARVLYALGRDELNFLKQRNFFSEDCLKDWKLSLLGGEVVVDFTSSVSKGGCDFAVHIYREGFDNREFVKTDELRRKIVDNLKFIAERNYKKTLEAKKKEEEIEKKEKEERVSLENALLKDLALDGDLNTKKEEPKKKEFEEGTVIIETVLDEGILYFKMFGSKEEHNEFLKKRKKDPKNILAGFTEEDKIDLSEDKIDLSKVSGISENWLSWLNGFGRRF